MPEPTRPTAAIARPEHPADLGAVLQQAMEFAVFERSAPGEFQVLGRAPAWLRRFIPEAAEAENRVSAAEIFPFLEVFLPDAEEIWSASGQQILSEIWTETAPDGTDCHLQARALNTGGRPLLVIELADTVHRERQLALHYAHEKTLQYDEIARLNREVERANRAKSEFLASMSHEIRTPLNAILGMAELLSESSLTLEQRKYVGIFQRAGSNLLNLINDILDLSKVESGNVTLERIPFDLGEVMERVVELITLRARDKGLTLAAHIAAEVPRTLMGDPTRLRQVLLNLLGNSMKFTENGGLEIRVELDPGCDTPGALRFAVADTGIGIPQDKLESIFESFTQADSSTTRQYGGTGLGLTISKDFVELMQGRIWVESAIGVGSTFFFNARFGIADPSQLAQPAVAVQAVALPPPVSGKTLHILLADDNEDNRFLIEAYLKAVACTVDMAENGEIALEKLKRGVYDIVLMDVHMPVMDGYTAVQLARESEHERNAAPLPILALTADAFQEAREKGRAAGFTGHLTKPISKAALLEALHTYANAGSVASVPKEAPSALALPDGAVRRRIQVDSSLTSIVGKFLENVRQNVQTISAAVSKSDFDTVRTLGHNMKGTGTSFGLPRVTELGAAIEEAAKTRDTEAVRARTSALGEFVNNVEIEFGSEAIP
jgi:signal transduction histidine kinase/CheY-like chemotaxis protein/HPt (histidine-containing phosphotransfer) domain-containing protein